MKFYFRLGQKPRGDLSDCDIKIRIGLLIFRPKQIETIKISEIYLELSRDIDQPTAVSDHFTLPGHSLNNLELIPLELINSNRDANRKAREAFLIYKGKTLEPSGMNRRDEI